MNTYHCEDKNRMHLQYNAIITQCINLCMYNASIYRNKCCLSQCLNKLQFRYMLNKGFVIITCLVLVRETCNYLAEWWKT